MKIRQATTEDTSSLLEMVSDLGYPMEFEILKDRIYHYSKSNHALFLAEKDTEIVGFIALAFYELFLVKGKICTIEGIATKLKRQGIGKALILEAEDYAKKQGSKIIHVTSGMRRAKDGSHDFYYSMGYNNEGPRSKLYLRKEL